MSSARAWRANHVVHPLRVLNAQLCTTETAPRSPGITQLYDLPVDGSGGAVLNLFLLRLL